MNRVLASAALLAVVALTSSACRRSGPDWRITQLYGGPGSVQALTDPTRVDAFRVSPKAHGAEPGIAYVGIHAVTAGPIPVPKDVAVQLSTLLSDAATYDWRRTKSDPYLPTIGLRFTRDVSRVDIALDFTSNMLTIHRHGKRISVEDFDDARPQLLTIVKALFPDDEDVQAID